jgi:gliding motility-associated protein GldC
MQTITFKVEVDENKLPKSINWEAEGQDSGACKSIMISLWDGEQKGTARIDLWTKDMKVDEMKQFFHQSLLTMADAFQRATGEKEIMDDLRDYCTHFAEKMEIIEK